MRGSTANERPPNRARRHPTNDRVTTARRDHGGPLRRRRPCCGSGPEWKNSGGWQAAADAHPEIDDHAYLAEIVADLTNRGIIRGDNDVFLVGFGEGAKMALAAAAEHPERYAGVAAFVRSGLEAVPAPRTPATRLGRVLLVTWDAIEGLDAAARAWALAMGRAGEAQSVRAHAVQHVNGMEQRDFSSDRDTGRAVRVVVLDAARDLFLPPGAADPLSLAASRRRPGFVDGAEEVWGFLRSGRSRG